MQWKTKEPRKVGDTKITWKFFWFPESINGMTYWLTFKKVKMETYMGKALAPECRILFDVLRWRIVEVVE